MAIMDGSQHSGPPSKVEWNASCAYVRRTEYSNAVAGTLEPSRSVIAIHHANADAKCRGRHKCSAEVVVELKRGTQLYGVLRTILWYGANITRGQTRFVREGTASAQQEEVRRGTTLIDRKMSS